MGRKEEITRLRTLLDKVMIRLATDQPPCQRKDDIKKKNDLLIRIKELQNE